MANWSEVEQLVSPCLAELLAEKLPIIGGERWWRNHVIGQLTPSQSMVAGGLEEGKLRELDLAALLRVCERNWSELAFRFGLDRSGRGTLKQMMDARNRYANRPVDGLPRDTVLADMQVASRLLTVIDADPRTIERCDTAREAFRASSADSADPQGPTRPIVSTRQPLVELADPVGREDASTGGWLVDPGAHAKDLETVLSDTTYVGIDFGTSTTVVSFAYMSPKRLLAADTLKLGQPDRYGGIVRDHLVSSVLAVYQGDKVLFGLDAQRLRPTLEDGRSVFTSFKMQLGVEIGPTYPRTRLRRGAGPLVVESARDAATEFFRFLQAAISEALVARDLQPNVKFAISVPASFEANQRRALLGCARDAGLDVDSSCLIDEPNAAFLSFMNACIHREQDEALARIMRTRGLNILVYDFGAGTCDVSVLQVALPGGRVRSKNLAISKFAALGGDDIDRAIAEEVLVPQLRAANPTIALTDTYVSRHLVPRLMPTAERLKIAINRWLTERRIETLEDVASFDESFSDQAFSHTISRRDGRGDVVKDPLMLRAPSLSTGELASVLRPFTGTFDELRPGRHVFQPVDDALSKSGLSPLDLDAVLFIGGSAKSPVVRECVMRHLPDSVRSLVPTDLQSHVSAGAAVHSLGFHGFGFHFVAPITSEPILVITRDGGVTTIVPASAPVPSEAPFRLSLTIDRDDQSTVELPVCVSSEAKLLGLLRLEAPGGTPFERGLRIDIEASVSEDKLLDIRASAAGVTVSSALLDPLANRELGQTERQLLEARQRYNIACLEAGGRPGREAVLAYAHAAQAADDHLLAADLFVQLESAGMTNRHATLIGYCYGRAGRPELAEKWARIAYERRPCAVTAFNMSRRGDRDERERYLREALRHKPSYECALISLGALLQARGESEGERMLSGAAESLKRELDDNRIEAGDCTWLARAADLLGDHMLSARSKARLDTLQGPDSRPFDNDNLADDPRTSALMVGR